MYLVTVPMELDATSKALLMAGGMLMVSETGDLKILFTRFYSFNRGYVDE